MLNIGFYQICVVSGNYGTVRKNKGMRQTQRYSVLLAEETNWRCLSWTFIYTLRVGLENAAHP